jgi:hypothetical protein
MVQAMQIVKINQDFLVISWDDMIALPMVLLEVQGLYPQRASQGVF